MRYIRRAHASQWAIHSRRFHPLHSGVALALGLFTRILAFIGAGEMAVAYFWVHAAGSGSIWWWVNRGETVMLFSFVWLVFAAYGAGPYSLDAWIAKRRQRAE